MVGTLQLARTLTDRELSDRVRNRGVETALNLLDQVAAQHRRPRASEYATGSLERHGCDTALTGGRLAVAHGHGRLQNVDAAPET
jgi:hypothetical protein